MKRTAFKCIISAAGIVLFLLTGIYLYRNILKPDTLSPITATPDKPLIQEVPRAKLTLSLEEIKEWNGFFERILSRPQFFKNFDEGKPLSDKDLIGYSINYIFSNKDSDANIKSMPEYDVFYKKYNMNVSRIKAKHIRDVAVEIFGATIQTDQALNKLIDYEDGYYWIAPHGFEGPGLVPRIMEYTDKGGSIISFKVEFYTDDFQMNPLHTRDGSTLTVDETFEKLLDNTTEFMEPPACKKMLTFMKVNTGSSERYILLAMNDY